MPMNKELIGREYPETRYRVTAEATEAYARATNETNARYFAGQESAAAMVAPPLFPVVYHPRALGQAIGDPELGIDFKRALHGEQDMRFHAPIRPGDEIRTGVKIVDIREKGTGETISLDLTSHDQDGTLVESTLFTLFVRGPSVAPAGENSKGSGESSTPAGDPVARVAQQLDSDQTFRYADASGDRTKIHLDEDAARRAGLPGIIGHGLCTMAFVSRALVDELAGGDPTRLERMSLRFAKPVMAGERIETTIRAAANPGDYAFETTNPRGEPVVSQGLAVIRSEPS